MKRGTNDIVNPMRGSTPINKVMRGTALVWQRENGLPRIYALANAIGSKIEFSDDLGVTWNTDTPNPSTAGEPMFCSVSSSGHIILIGMLDSNPVKSLDSGGSWDVITTENLLTTRAGGVSGGGGDGYFAEANSPNDILSTNGCVTFTQSTPGDNRFRSVSLNEIGIYGLRTQQAEYWYNTGGGWISESVAYNCQSLAVARNNSYLYLGDESDTLSRFTPPNTLPSGIQYIGGTFLTVACSGDGSHVLVSDGITRKLWLSTTFGTSPVDITSRFTFTDSSVILLRNNTYISTTGQYMVIPDRGAIHVSSDYGATWTKRSMFFGSSNYTALAVTG